MLRRRCGTQPEFRAVVLPFHRTVEKQQANKRETCSLNWCCNVNAGINGRRNPWAPTPQRTLVRLLPAATVLSSSVQLAPSTTLPARRRETAKLCHCLYTSLKVSHDVIATGSNSNLEPGVASARKILLHRRGSDNVAFVVVHPDVASKVDTQSGIPPFSVTYHPQCSLSNCFFRLVDKELHH